MPGLATGGFLLILPGSSMLRPPNSVPALRKQDPTMKLADLPKRCVIAAHDVSLNVHCVHSVRYSARPRWLIIRSQWAGLTNVNIFMKRNST